MFLEERKALIGACDFSERDFRGVSEIQVDRLSWQRLSGVETYNANRPLCGTTAAVLSYCFITPQFFLTSVECMRYNFSSFSTK